MVEPTKIALQQLLHDHWEFCVREDPLLATQSGDHRFDDRLPALAETDMERRLVRMREFLTAARAIAPERLDEEDRLNLTILRRALEDDIAELEFRGYRMPISRAGGTHAGLADLGASTSAGTREDYEHYIARLQAFPACFQDTIDVMRAGICEGQVMPRVAMAGVPESIHAQLVDDPTRSALYEPFTRMPRTIDPAEAQRLDAAGRAAIMNAVVPAYKQLLDFVVDEYIPATRTEIALGSIPNGPAYYAHRVRQYTTLDVSPQEVHQVGLGEVRRIRGEMEEAIRRLGFSGSVRDFYQQMRADPRFYVDTPDALLKEAALIAKRIDGELPRLFKKLPRIPYGIRPTPDFIAPSSTTAYYFPLAGDGTRAGFYYVNTYDVKSRPLYEYEALTLHEAVPGHHLQMALQQEIADMPNLRRFGWVTAFGEGWALYAERLGLEIGLYQDPYSNLGRLTYEMWRACRLVVDTGMHALGWSRQQAIDLMLENTALSRLNVENEVDRYISWPGQSLAYKMGELKIRELRALAERELGARFDVREFHDVVLRHGGIPLAVLEENVRAWVKSEVGSRRSEIGV